MRRGSRIVAFSISLKFVTIVVMWDAVIANEPAAPPQRNTVGSRAKERREPTNVLNVSSQLFFMSFFFIFLKSLYISKTLERAYQRGHPQNTKYKL